MFIKILISEDIDSINLGLSAALTEFHSGDILNAKYCDEAILKIKKAILDQEPFDLLITDLSFKEDHRASTLKSGEDLIRAARQIQPNLKIIAYSIEDRPYKIKYLLEELNIDGYIAKGRDSIGEFKKAISLICSSDDKYLPSQYAHVLRDTALVELEDYDVLLLRYLSVGLSQDEISVKFKANNLGASSTSSIEKRINRLKVYFGANNTIHLVSIAKDLGVI